MDEYYKQAASVGERIAQFEAWSHAHASGIVTDTIHNAAVAYRMGDLTSTAIALVNAKRTIRRSGVAVPQHFLGILTDGEDPYIEQ